MEDKNYWSDKINFIAGCDEVGRGPLAGPVVASCFFLSQAPTKLDAIIEEFGITDSKKLSSRKRIEILNKLNIDIAKITPGKKFEISHSVIEGLSFSLVEIQHDVIDKINILNASLLAMRESFSLLFQQEKGVLLVDGNKSCLKNEPFKTVEEFTLVKGDQRSGLIALASIVAKEYRDRLMINYGKKYPNYGFESHAGYPTKFHKEAIEKYGVTKIHRRSFKGVKEFTTNL